jgi:23S rRNA (cytosine1962-C5)-methyltransferase
VQLHTLIGESWPDYGLVDSGDGRKLERYGPHRFIRPEPQALWSPATAGWQADAEFVPGSDEDGGGKWRFDKPVSRDGWPLAWDDVRFTAQATPFRHLGFFPDMAPVWTWMRERLASPSRFREGAHLSPCRLREGSTPECLNLFGYTGVGSLALAAAGARVTHVDASKKSVEAARGNARLSGLAESPVRWLVDDAAKFVAREGRRGRRYDGILLDPPKFGRGPEGEVWRLEEHLPALVAGCRQLLDADSRFLFLTVYAVRMSALAIGEMLRQALADLPGTVEAGELGVREEARGLVLPTAIWARWSR